MDTFTRDGIAFSYLDRGTGEPFVFQHGLGGAAGQPDGLYDPARRLVCLECRGHGATHPLGDPGELGFATFAADVVALMDHLELDRVVLGGVSMGAGVAARIAAQHPDRVRALVLVRPAWFEAPNPANLDVFATLVPILRATGNGAGKAVLRQTAAFRAIASRSPAVARSLLSQFDRPPTRDRAEVLHRLPADAPLAGITTGWAGITAPTLVLATDGDPMHPRAIAEQVTAALPHAELRIVTSKDVDDARHAREVAAAIEAFVATLA